MKYLRMDVVRGLKAIIDEKTAEMEESQRVMANTNRKIEDHYDNVVRPELIEHLQGLLRFILNNPSARLNREQLNGRAALSDPSQDGDFMDSYSGWTDKFAWNPNDLKDFNRYQKSNLSADAEKNLLLLVTSVDEEMISTYSVKEAGFNPSILARAVVVARKLDQADEADA